ncbi:MAG: RNA polymerase sigma factor [Christensenellales bacterium]
MLFRVGRRLLDSDENPDTLYDMVQEIFLLLWDRRETLKTHPNIGGWLMAALKFRILGERGRVTRRALRHAYSLDDDGAAPVSDRALSPEERAVFAGMFRPSAGCSSRTWRSCSLITP